MPAPLPTAEAIKAAEATWLETVRQSVQSLQFGSVQITVHHGAVVQIERIEKIRIEPAASAATGAPSPSPRCG